MRRSWWRCSAQSCSGGIGAGRRRARSESLARTASEPALAYAYRFVFLAAMLVLCFGLAFLIAMEEKPLQRTGEKTGEELPVDHM